MLPIGSPAKTAAPATTTPTGGMQDYDISGVLDDKLLFMSISPRHAPNGLRNRQAILVKYYASIPVGTVTTMAVKKQFDRPSIALFLGSTVH